MEPIRHPAERPTRSFWPTVAVIMTIVAVISTTAAVWFYRQSLAAAKPTTPDDVIEPRPDRRVLIPTTWDSLEGWSTDKTSAALPALERTCEVFGRRAPDSPVGPDGLAGRVADWLPACESIAAAVDDGDLRAALEENLQPVQVLNNHEDIGLFTGYYEPSLDGSRQRSERFDVPLYRKPEDLLSIDLEAFHERYVGKSISGRIDDGTFMPYFERADIDSGALDERGLELVWVDDPVDAFFLHVQGSGRVALAEGGEMRVGYAGQNGRPYFAIGRDLVNRGALTIEQVSLQSIRAWLAANPGEAQAVMATNPSFVFFHELKGEGPLGTMGVALTPGRSLAVDRSLLPLGVPIWLDATSPDPNGPEALPLQRLMVAQDTGGAIKGPVRGDVFWGHGPEAREVAGRMKNEGRLWLLLPRSVVATLAAEDG